MSDDLEDRVAFVIFNAYHSIAQMLEEDWATYDGKKSFQRMALAAIRIVNDTPAEEVRKYLDGAVE